MALFVSPEAPFPVAGGGALRSASLLTYLAARYRVHAVCFHAPPDPDPRDAFPPGLVERIDVLPLPEHSRHWPARAWRNAGRLLRSAPPLLDRFNGQHAALREALGGNRYEVAVLEHFWTAGYRELASAHAGRVVLNLHNIESILHRRCGEQAGLPVRMTHFRFAAAYRARERAWLPGFDRVLVASEADARMLGEIAPSAHLSVYPNTIPATPLPSKERQHAVAFSGNMAYGPNLDAIAFFEREVWPTLGARFPALHWWLVGGRPDALPSRLRRAERVVVTGPVEDAVSTLARAKVAVVPLRAGSGTRLKIVEAWAAGLPVVSTSLGAEGLPGVAGVHWERADQPREFLEAISGLLTSPERSREMGAAGRSLYERELTWEAAWRTLRNQPL